MLIFAQGNICSLLLGSRLSQHLNRLKL